MTAWIWLLVAGALEIGWAIALKVSDGFARPGVGAVSVVGMILSFLALAQAMRTLPAGTATIGMLFLGEPRDLPRAACIGMIVACVLGLKALAK